MQSKHMLERVCFLNLANASVHESIHVNACMRRASMFKYLMCGQCSMQDHLFRATSSRCKAQGAQDQVEGEAEHGPIRAAFASGARLRQQQGHATRTSERVRRHQVDAPTGTGTGGTGGAARVSR